MTPYYEDGWATIYHGDVLDILPYVASFDVVITSPPYNLGTVRGAYANMSDGYDDHDDGLADDAYVLWQQSVIKALWDRLPSTGALFYNHKPLIRDRSLMLPTRLIPPGVTLRQIIVWDRGVGMNWSPSHFRPQHEWVLVLAHDEFRLRSRGHSTVGDVWRLAINQENFGHPCPFPVTLPGQILDAVEAATVLDPFMGSGSTLVAAKRRGVRSAGIDLSERYCEMAARRLAQGVLDFGAST